MRRSLLIARPLRGDRPARRFFGQIPTPTARLSVLPGLHARDRHSRIPRVDGCVQPLREYPLNSFAIAAALLLLPGCDIEFGRVGFFWLLWLVPVMIAFTIFVFRSKTRRLRGFVSEELLERILAGVSRPRQVLKAALVILAVALGVLTLTEIRWGFTWEEVKRRGVDIVIALDVSDSMLVEDAQSGGQLTRLERAKREITDLFRLLDGDRVGLVAFAGVAFVECPLTLDYAAAEIFLDDVDTELIPVKGTAIGDAIRASLGAFEGGAEDSRAIILITDGEDHTGEALAAAEEAKAMNVRIFPIGIGRDEGAPIPQPGGGFRRDRRGEMIMSRLDEPTLQKVALATGGRYVRSVTGDVDLEQIYSNGIKASLEDQELSSRRRKRWEERFQWVLALCLALLAVEPFIRERKRVPGDRTSGAAAAMLLLMLPSLAAAQTSPLQPIAPAQPVAPAGPAAPAQPASPVDATRPAMKAPRTIDDPYDAYDAGAYDQALRGFTDLQVEHPQDPTLMMSIGSTHYRVNDFVEAERAFAAAAVAGDEPLRAEAFYNLGNVAYRQGKLEEAIQRYQAALEINPDDQDAKFNIELVRDEIRRRHEEAQKRQQQQGQGQEQQQQGQEQQQQGQEQQQQGQEQQQQGEAQQSGRADQDGDGLSDELERAAENPTDPSDPDSDDDGLLDGQEDVNQNGRVDEQETDPNKQDSDGDGVPDAAEVAAQQQQQQAPEEQHGMTQDQAERYLQMLDDDRPNTPHREARGRRSRPLKDW